MHATLYFFSKSHLFFGYLYLYRAHKTVSHTHPSDVEINIRCGHWRGAGFVVEEEARFISRTRFRMSSLASGLVSGDFLFLSKVFGTIFLKNAILAKRISFFTDIYA